jgi:hypothetical protein
MRACLLRFICCYHGRKWSQLDWTLALRIFPGSYAGAVQFAVVDFPSALAVVRKVSWKTGKDYTLSDLTMALCLIPIGPDGTARKKVGYHPDMNLPYTLRPPQPATTDEESDAAEKDVPVVAKSSFARELKLHIVSLSHGCINVWSLCEFDIGKIRFRFRFRFRFLDILLSYYPSLDWPILQGLGVVLYGYS